MEQGPQKGTSALFTMRILWAGMFTAQLLFLFIVASDKGIRPEALSASDFLQSEIFVFGFIALINAGAGFFLPKFLVKGSLRGRILQNPVEVFQVTFPALLIRLAVFEAISVFGFASAMQTGKGAIILPFTLLSTLLFLLSFPRYELLRSWTK